MPAENAAAKPIVIKTFRLNGFLDSTYGILRPKGKNNNAFIKKVRYNSGCCCAKTKVMNGCNTTSSIKVERKKTVRNNIHIIDIRNNERKQPKLIFTFLQQILNNTAKTTAKKTINKCTDIDIV